MRWSLVTGIAFTLFASAVRGQIPLSEYAERRAKLAASLGDGVFVARGAEEPVQDYMSFFQSPGFEYLTGYREPNAALVMTKSGKTVSWMLFVEKKIPAVEVWSGRRNGAEVAARLTGVPARENSFFESTLDSLARTSDRIWVLADIAESGDTLNKDVAFVAKLRAKHAAVQIAGANDLVAKQRGTKSAAELELLRKAIAISVDAHREAMLAVKPGMNEFELHALVEYTFRRNGADRPAYASIVGSGANATVLHYNKNDGFLGPNDVVVMDVAANYKGYAADLTRSFPVGGTFTAEQRAIYQIVRDAQAAAERNARPGMLWKATGDSAKAALATGLAKLGLIESPTATYECNGGQRCDQISLFYMHGLGHGIGLEVHDPDQMYYDGKIGVGSAFTLEPGIYVRENLLDLVPNTPANRGLRERLATLGKRYANIGIRIEDDYLVSERGLEWTSCGLPREASEIEALMRQPKAGPAPRDPVKVEWYRGSADKPSAPAGISASCVRM